MPSRLSAHSRIYVFVLGGVALVAGGLAVFTDNTSLGFASAILGLYVLHLYSMQVMQQQWRALQGLERLVGELGLADLADGDEEGALEQLGAGEASPTAAGDGGREAEESEAKVRKDFALGTVAIVKGVMTPAEVAQVMARQRSEPGLTFGDHAVEMGYLSETQLEDLTQTRHEGLYGQDEIRRARRRIQDYRTSVDPEGVGA